MDSYHGHATFMNLVCLRYRAWDFDYYTSCIEVLLISDDNVNSILPMFLLFLLNSVNNSTRGGLVLTPSLHFLLLVQFYCL